jgi:hypothetical protein
MVVRTQQQETKFNVVVVVVVVVVVAVWVRIMRCKFNLIPL